MLYASSILNRYRKFILFNPSRDASLSILSTQIPHSITNIFRFYRFRIREPLYFFRYPSIYDRNMHDLSIFALYHYNVCLTARRLFFFFFFLIIFITPYNSFHNRFYSHNVIYISLYTELSRRIDLFVFIVKRFGARLINTKKEARESDSNRVRFMTLR